MLEFFLLGILLGLSAGFVPGPLMAVAVSETLRGRLKNGLLVSVSPLITDVPIVLIALLILRQFSDNEDVLAVIQCTGGLYLIYLAFGNFSYRQELRIQTHTTGSLQKGIIANFLNPSPYLWWITVGAPTVLAAWQDHKSYAVVFVLSFYCLLVGSKMVIVVLTDGFRGFVRSKWYRWLLHFLGLLLLVLGIYLAAVGISALVG